MTSQISCKLIEEKRKNVIVRIFGLLDSDKDGIISYEKIEINGILLNFCIFIIFFSIVRRNT